MPARFVSGCVVFLLIAAVPAVSGAAPTPDDPKGSPRAEGIFWPPGRVLPSFAHATHLDVVDLTEAGGDDRLLLSTLQGIVNRKSARIYLLEYSEEGKMNWLEDLDVPYTLHEDKWDLLRLYRNEISGMIVLDPQVPDSKNVAVTMAGLRDAVVATPWLAAYLRSFIDIPIVENLTGRFLDGRHAYQWQYDNLWPHTTHRMLIGLHSKNPVQIPPAPGVNLTMTFGALHDYAVANRAAVVFLDTAKPDELALFERYLGDMPPMSAYLGWFPHDVGGEFTGVEALSRNRILTVPADFFSNLTVFSGVRAPNVPPAAPPVPALENRIYVTFAVTEGDNLQYVQHRMRAMWDDPARGEIPITWTIQPLLLEAAPAMLHHYQRTATPNDEFMVGPSGAGYIFPDPWPDPHIGDFTSLTRRFMDETGMRTALVYNRPDRVTPLTEAEISAYETDMAPGGILFNWFYDNRVSVERLPQGTPLVRGRAVCSVQEGRDALSALTSGWDGSAPLFIAIGITAWCQSPSQIKEVASVLGPEASVVRSDHFFQLLRQAG